MSDFPQLEPVRISTRFSVREYDTTPPSAPTGRSTHLHSPPQSALSHGFSAELHANVDPSSILPVELMDEIFMFACYSFDPRDRLACTLAIAAVCRQWREIALGNSALWATFDLSWPQLFGATIVSRMGSRPVDVIMSTIADPTGGLEHLPPFQRWRSLHLTCTPSSRSWDVFVELSPNLQHLESLSLDMDASNPGDAEQIQMGSFIPNLLALRVVNIPSSIVWSPLTSKLVDLRFDIIVSDRGLRKILAQCTSLQTLTIHSVVQEGVAEGRVTWKHAPIIMPSTLRALYFLNIPAAYACHIVQWLQAPSLRKLAICTMYGSFPPAACFGSAWSDNYLSFFANLPQLVTFYARCEMHLLATFLKAMTRGFSAVPGDWADVKMNRDAGSSPPRLPSAVYPDAQKLFLSHLREVGLALTGYTNSVEPSQTSPLSQQMVKSGIDVLLTSMRDARQNGDERLGWGTKALMKLQLSGISLSWEEKEQLENYTWDLRL